MCFGTSKRGAVGDSKPLPGGVARRGETIDSRGGSHLLYERLLQDRSGGGTRVIRHLGWGRQMNIVLFPAVPCGGL